MEHEPEERPGGRVVGGRFAFEDGSFGEVGTRSMIMSHRLSWKLDLPYEPLAVSGTAPSIEIALEHMQNEIRKRGRSILTRILMGRVDWSNGDYARIFPRSHNGSYIVSDSGANTIASNLKIPNNGGVDLLHRAIVARADVRNPTRTPEEEAT